MSRSITLIALLSLCACASHGHVGISGDGSERSVDTVKAPLQDRCESLRSAPTTFAQCQSARATVIEYLRTLNTGDEVCLEGGFGDDPGSDCKARGHVVDADDHGFVIQIRDPSIDSVWKNDAGQRIYFENGALVDLYLRDRGYQ